jgi:hypothetical protein
MATSAAYIDLDEGAAPSTPASGQVRIYAKTDGSAYQKDDAGTETGLAGAAGSVATDAIWDAAQDLVVGTGANTAARLGIGPAGSLLARINGAVAWNAGTSFPTAGTGDIYHRTDLRIPLWRYDGSQWLCTCAHENGLDGLELLIPFADAGATRTVGRALVSDEFPIFIHDFLATTFVATNDSSNYWTVGLDWETAAISATSLATFTTQADTQANFVRHRVAIDAVLNANARDLRVTATDTGAPGTLRVMPRYSWNYIAT